MKTTLLLIIAISGFFPVFSQNDSLSGNKSLKVNPMQSVQDTSQYWDDRLYVKFKSKALVKMREFKGTQNRQAALSNDNISNILQKYDATDFRSLPESNKLPSSKAIYELKVPKGKALTDIIYDLQNQPEVEYVERVPKYRTFAVPNDSRFSNQYSLTKVQAPAAYDLVKGSAQTLVAVVDVAFMVSHEDLKNNFDLSKSYDVADNDNDVSPPVNTSPTSFTHGTMCAGVVGAVTNNNVGVASISNNKVKMMAVKVTPDTGSDISIYNDYEGILYAIEHGAKVVSMSFGGGGFSQTLQDLFNDGAAAGVLFIAAAGNNNLEYKQYPAAHENVLAVASSDENDKKSGFSNFGTWIDVSAPGSNILMTSRNGSASTYEPGGNGTSLACPMVASLAGLILAQNPSLTPQAVEQIIKSSVDPIDNLNSGYAGKLGTGRINALKALQATPAKDSPFIFSFSPTVALPGTTVTIKGSNFTGVTSVTFGNVRATFSVLNSSTITAIVPSGAVDAPIRVIKSTTTAESFKYFYVGYFMSSTSVSTCNNSFLDPGGANYYTNNLNVIKTFTPSTPYSKLKCTFSSFDTEAGYDILYIYNGPNTSSPLIGSYSGTNKPGTITASNPTGQLTFRFVSDGSTVRPGWTASFSCVSIAALWNKRFGGSSYEGLTSLLQTSDGGYLLAGYSGSGISGDKTEASRGGEDYWVVKISSSGSKQWDKRFGGSAIDGLSSAIQTSDGGYLLGGTSQSGISGDKTEASRGLKDYWVVKITSNGSKQWDKRFGGTSDDVLKAMLPTADGGYLLAGRSKSGSGGDKTEASRGGEDYWVVKVSSSGSKQWDKRFGGSGDDHLTAVASSIDGGYLLGGYSASGSGGDKTHPSRGYVDYWVVKISSSGVKQSDIRFGGIYSDYLSSLTRTSDGGYLLGGSSHSEAAGGDKSQASIGHTDYWVVKLSSNGIKEWDKTFGGYSEDELASVIQTIDGGYLLGGTSVSVAGGHKSEESMASNYWAIKISNSGLKQWDKTFGGSSTDELSSVIQTPDGGYLLGGTSHSGISGDKSEASRGNSDYWIIKTTQEAPKSTDYVMSNSSKITCSGAFYDPGFMGMYGNNQTITQTFSPASSASKLQFKFTSFSLESGNDFLYIYNGSSTSAPLIGSYSGTTSPSTVTATNPTGQLTFRFTSNAATTKAGWTASISCVSITACTASGSILREYWASVTGTAVSAIPLTTPPTSTSQLSSFEAPTNTADNYGQRVRGYLCAPSTGNYTFYIASDDNSELWLSTDDNPANKQRIASITGWTNSKEWTKFASQKSAAISLQAGRRYYIEALHKEGTGGDNLAVGWMMPNTSNIAVIPGSPLSPFVIASTARIASEENIETAASITAFPNPFEDKLTLSLSGLEGKLVISVMDVLGNIHLSTISQVASGQVELELSQLKPGLYFASLQREDGQSQIIRVVKK